MKILIDTHILIWVLQNKRDALSPIHQSLLDNQRHEKIVSQISFMELAIKLNIGKLPDFTIPLKQFIKQVEDDGFTIMPLKDYHITTYVSLPLVPDHRDPFDRFLIATAFAEDIYVMTDDKKFTSYDTFIKLI